MEVNLFLNDFKQNCIFRLDESLRMVNSSFGFIAETDVWKKPNSSLNSIGNLILHLCGNMTQYVISGVGNIPDTRNRNAEFEIESGMTKSELLAQLEATVQQVKKVLEDSTIENLLEIRNIQGFQFSGIGAIIHAVEHFSYHTGQIAFWVKYLKAKDLGFYGGIDLTQTNS